MEKKVGEEERGHDTCGMYMRGSRGCVMHDAYVGYGDVNCRIALGSSEFSIFAILKIFFIWEKS